MGGLLYANRQIERSDCANQNGYSVPSPLQAALGLSLSSYDFRMQLLELYCW